MTFQEFYERSSWGCLEFLLEDPGVDKRGVSWYCYSENGVQETIGICMAWVSYNDSQFLKE